MNEYLQILINAAVTGMGCALGTYFANKAFIQHLEKLSRNGKKT